MSMKIRKLDNFEEIQLDDINNWPIHNLNNRINILHQNIRGARTNFQQFKLYISDKIQMLDVIILTEVKFSEKDLCKGNVNLEKFEITGFKLEIKLRRKGRGGGIMVYVRETIPSTFTFTENSSFESIAVTVKLNNANEIKIFGIYRPPECNKTVFINELETMIQNCKNKSVVLIGDINVNLKKLDKSTVNDLLNVMATGGMYKGISVDTRVVVENGKIKRSCIDNVLFRLSNDWDESKTQTLSITTKITDHYMVGLSISCKTAVKQTKQIKYAKIIDGKRLSREIAKVDWEKLCKEEDPDKIYDTMVNEFSNVYDKCEKGKKIKERNTDQPWATDEIKLEIRKRDELFRKWKRDYKNEEARKVYNKFRNEVNRKIWKMQTDYYAKELEKNKNNVKKTWTTINKIIGRKVKTKGVDDIILKYMNKEDSNQKYDIANNFGKTFKKEIEDIGHDCNLQLTQQDEETKTEMTAEYATEYEVESILKEMKINKGPGYDRIRMIDLINNKKRLVPVITRLINQSIKLQKFPTKLKIAIYRPVYKRGEHSNYKNYRPISILSSIDKIIEKFMHKKISSYVENNNILSESQFGFRKGIGTNQLLNKFTNNVYSAMNERKYTLCLFIDFTKAFDTVRHSKLLQEMKRIGVEKNVLGWCKSYLENRKFVVNVDGTYSEMFDLGDCGVPQGSIIGPLFYNIYASSVCAAVKYSKIYMFADDTCIMLSGWDVKYLYHTIQEDLINILEWAHDNNIVLNASKSCTMLIHDGRKNIDFDLTNNKLTVHNYSCLHGKKYRGWNCGCESKIQNVNSFRYLGVIIDSRMSWNEQINKITGKLRGCLTAMHRLKSMKSYKIMKLAYHAIGESHLTYGITAWGNLPKYARDKIGKVQERIFKVLLNIRSKTEVETILEVLPLEKLLILRLILEYYWDQEIKNKKLETNRPLLRTKKVRNYLVPKRETMHMAKTHQYMIPHIWNHLPEELTNLENYNQIKYYMKEWLLEFEVDCLYDSELCTLLGH